MSEAGHHDLNELMKEFGIPSMIVGMANFEEWLSGIGIAVHRQAIMAVGKKRDIPISRSSTIGTPAYTFDTDAIKEYVRGLVGVPLECWLEERRRERKSKRQRIFCVRSPLLEKARSVIGKGISPLFLATVSRSFKGPHSGFMYDTPIIIKGRLWATRDPRTAERWDYGSSGETWKIWSYGSLYNYDPRVAEKKHIPYIEEGNGLATSVLCFETLDEECKPAKVMVPSRMLGESRESATVQAIIPANHPERRNLAKFINAKYPAVKLLVWSHGVRRSPMTLDPILITARDKRHAREQGSGGPERLISVEDEHA